MAVCCIPASILAVLLHYALRGLPNGQNMYSKEELLTFIELHSEESSTGNPGAIEARTVSLIRSLMHAEEIVVGDVSSNIDRFHKADGHARLTPELITDMKSWKSPSVLIYERHTKDSKGCHKTRYIGALDTFVGLSHKQHANITLIGFVEYPNNQAR